MVEEHDHVYFSIIGTGRGSYDGIKSDERAAQVVESRRRNKFLVKTNKTGWLSVDNVKLEVNNLFWGYG